MPTQHSQIQTCWIEEITLFLWTYSGENLQYKLVFMTWFKHHGLTAWLHSPSLFSFWVVLDSLMSAEHAFSKIRGFSWSLWGAVWFVEVVWGLALCQSFYCISPTLHTPPFKLSLCSVSMPTRTQVVPTICLFQVQRVWLLASKQKNNQVSLVINSQHFPLQQLPRPWKLLPAHIHTHTLPHLILSLVWNNVRVNVNFKWIPRRYSLPRSKQVRRKQ